MAFMDCLQTVFAVDPGPDATVPRRRHYCARSPARLLQWTDHAGSAVRRRYVDPGAGLPKQPPAEATIPAALSGRMAIPLYQRARPPGARTTGPNWRGATVPVRRRAAA